MKQQQLSDDLTNIIKELFFEVDLYSIVCFLSSKTEETISTNRLKKNILTDSEIQKDIFVSYTLIKQLVKADAYFRNQKIKY